MRACGGREASALQCVTHSAAVLKQGSIQQLNLLLLTNQGQWGVTAAEEEEENKRIREFQDSIPKMCSQLRILTHFYQVSIGMRRGVCPLPGPACFQRMGDVAPHPCCMSSTWDGALGGAPPPASPLRWALFRAAVQLGKWH